MMFSSRFWILFVLELGFWNCHFQASVTDGSLVTPELTRPENIDHFGSLDDSYDNRSLWKRPSVVRVVGSGLLFVPMGFGLWNRNWTKSLNKTMVKQTLKPSLMTPNSTTRYTTITTTTTKPLRFTLFQVICITTGTVLLVLLIVGLVYWIWMRRRRRTRKRFSSISAYHDSTKEKEEEELTQTLSTTEGPSYQTLNPNGKDNSTGSPRKKKPKREGHWPVIKKDEVKFAIQFE